MSFIFASRCILYDKMKSYFSPWVHYTPIKLVYLRHCLTTTIEIPKERNFDWDKQINETENSKSGNLLEFQDYEEKSLNWFNKSINFREIYLWVIRLTLPFNYLPLRVETFICIKDPHNISKGLWSW